MGQNENSKYEMVVIVDAALGNDDKEAVKKEIADVIVNAGGKVINSQVWLDKQKFTFEIKKAIEGTYYIINFDGDSTVSEKIKSILKLNEKILRFITIKVESRSAAAIA